MIDVVHMLPWALLAAVLTGAVEVGVLHLLRNRSAAANIAALVIIPILAVLIFVVAISGFMYSPALAATATACALIAVVVIPVAVFLGRRIALGRDGRRAGTRRRTRPPRRPAGNWSPGSATTCGRRWPGSGR